jgi:cell division protease FtsH
VNLNGGAPTGPVSQRKGPSPAAIFALLAAAALVIIFFVRKPAAPMQEIPYSLFRERLEEGLLLSVNIRDGGTVEIRQKDGALYKTKIPYDDPTLMPALLEEGNSRKEGLLVDGTGRAWNFWRIAEQSLPFLLAFLLVLFLVRNMQAGPGGRAFAFGRSKAKRYHDNEKKATFEDVAGQKDAKYELQEVVAFLKNPEKFTKMGARIPKGVLLVGMPGTGKTLMARAVAGEAGVSFFHMSGSDFVEMFVGVGASRVRDLFEQGRKSAPCIIFIDELDAVGRTRGAGYGGGHDEREQTLNQLLVEMDGFDSKEGVIILAATNRPDVLDPALLRPGRFDRQVTVAMPDIREREDILNIHVKNIPLDDDVDLSRVARSTPGMSGADIANLANEAALYAARKDKDVVAQEDFEEARDKILMGVARSALVMSDKERRMTAVHEAGHALLHYFLENADPLHKVTIVPHGQALGMALSLPEEDHYSRTRGWIEARIVICYGGWTAENLLYNETTTGTKQDIQQATELARHMVCEWGMHGGLGPVAYGQEDEPIFLAREIARRQNYSDDTARRIDKAVQEILDQGRERARQILSKHRGELVRLSDALIERETLTDDEVRGLLGLFPA